MIFDGIEVEEIEGYEDLYAVSRCGKVCSLPGGHSKNGRWLKGKNAGAGYLAVCLCYTKTQRYKYIHRLISEQFDPNFDLEKEVNHKDGNKLNNIMSNLECITTRQNSHHAIKTKLHLPNKSSLYMGVCWMTGKSKWLASMHINKKSKHIGAFSTEIEAAEAYNNFILDNNLDIPLNVIKE